MRAVALVGFAKSGKTTLAVDLARELTGRGLSVAAAKFSHHPLDTPGRDTARLAEVCSVVAGLGPDEAMITWPRRRHLADLLPLMQADVLLVEGGKTLGWLPRVLLLREPGEASDLRPDLALGSFGEIEAPDIPRIPTVAALADAVLARGFALPGLDCAACGFADCREMAAAVVAGQAGPDDCKAARPEALRVTIDGRPLGLNPFVAGVIAGSLKGMLAALKGFAPGRIVIEMEP